MSTDIRIGDRFKVTGAVIGEPEAEVVAFSIDGDAGMVLVDRKALLASERLPREIKAGDRVMFEGQTGTVETVKGKLACVSPDDGDLVIYHITRLRALGVSMEGGE